MWGNGSKSKLGGYLYPTSDDDALDHVPLLDDRGIKSSYDCLYTRQPSKEKAFCRDGYLPRQKRS